MKKKIECKNIKFLIQKEVDGLIKTDEREILHEHIKECSGCLKEREELISLHNLIRSNLSEIKVPSISDTFDRKFYNRLKEEEEEKKKISLINILPLNITFNYKITAVTVMVIFIAVAGLREYQRYSRLPKSDSSEVFPVNTDTLYRTITEKSELQQQKNNINKQTREILSIAGIRG